MTILSIMSNMDGKRKFSTPRQADEPPHFSRGLLCPCCGGLLIRIPRQPLDRLLSLVVPLQRYQCRAWVGNTRCMWEGVLDTRHLK